MNKFISLVLIFGCANATSTADPSKTVVSEPVTTESVTTKATQVGTVTQDSGATPTVSTISTGAITAEAGQIAHTQSEISQVLPTESIKAMTVQVQPAQAELQQAEPQQVAPTQAEPAQTESAQTKSVTKPSESSTTVPTTQVPTTQVSSVGNKTVDEILSKPMNINDIAEAVAGIWAAIKKDNELNEATRQGLIDMGFKVVILPNKQRFKALDEGLTPYKIKLPNKSLMFATNIIQPSVM